MKKLFVSLLIAAVSMSVLTGCKSTLPQIEQDKKAIVGIWMETVPDSGNIEMQENGAVRIFDTLQVSTFTGTWVIPEVGKLNIELEGQPVVNLGYKFEDDTFSVWPLEKVDQPLIYKKATQDDINVMQKKAKEYADKMEKENGTPPTPDMNPEKGELTMTQEEAKKETITAIFETTAGEIELILYPKVAPLTVANFTKLIQEGYYDGTIFHRVIPQFMIQFGAFGEDGAPKPSVPSFKDEINPTILNVNADVIQENIRKGYQYDYTLPSLPMVYGALAMANAGANTNSSQVFIVTKFDGCSWLDGAHTVFGECVQGMDTAMSIQNAPRDSMDKPNENIVIKKAYLKD